MSTSLPYQAHSATSKQAALRFAGQASKSREKIFLYLSQFPDGLTDEEMQDDLDIPSNTQRPRRRELYVDGILADSGKTRKTRSGMDAVLWVVTGKPYCDRADPPKKKPVIDPELTGTLKAIAEIEAAIPPHRRSPELVDLLGKFRDFEESNRNLGDYFDRFDRDADLDGIIESP